MKIVRDPPLPPLVVVVTTLQTRQRMTGRGDGSVTAIHIKHRLVCLYKAVGARMLVACIEQPACPNPKLYIHGGCNAFAHCVQEGSMTVEIADTAIARCHDFLGVTNEVVTLASVD